MKRVTLALVLVFAGACEDEKDSPEVAQRKAECRRLEDHIFEIMPRPGAEHGEADPKKREALVAALPVEDIEQCAAVKDRKVIACMQEARDVATLRACVPASKE
jgi:hypothetical protein